MVRLLALAAPVLAGLVAAQDSAAASSTTSYDVVPTPDALPIDFLRDVDVPVYTSIPGLDSDIIFYATATAIQAAAAEQSESPLSVFPAVTSVPINAAGESDDDDDSVAAATTTVPPERRGLEARAACATQATISNYYNVKVDSYSGFVADPTISSVALSAPTPSGYFNNFKNLGGASSAYAYLGYAIVNSGKTGYDVNWCASKCNAISGCLSFNIYFERDPVLEPGASCTNPDAFPNIKCSFWGSALDATTATNKGQWRSSFQVGIAGSNGYTSYRLGGPISGWNTPLALNNAAMNAPARDCADTWTYMGFKLFQSGPYDPNLCSAACDSQTAYNLAHPPSTGKAPKCAAFGSYILSMTNKTGTYVQGQMCTMYTSDWDKKYAVNTVGYDDSIGAKYTYSYSFFYAKPAVQPICKSDIQYLISSGSDFCTSFIGYSAPKTTKIVSVTPSPVTDFETSTSVATVFGTGTNLATATITGSPQWKKRDVSADSAASVTAISGVIDNTVSVETVASVPASSAIVLATYAETITVTNGTVPTHAPSNLIAKRGILAARAAIPTPTGIASWSAARISEACSDVATGTATVTTTATASTSTTTVYTTTVASTTLQACVVPSQVAGYETFTPIWGKWSDNTVGDLGYAVAQEEKTIQLPFSMSVGGVSSSVVTVATNGYIKVGTSDSAVLAAFQGQGEFLYVYGGNNGVFYRIAGEEGSRSIVFSWHTGTYNWGHMQEHFTITYFEDRPNHVQYKYYDIIQSGLYEAQAYVYANNKMTTIRQGSPFSAGEQISITANSASDVTFSSSTHDRVDCCTKRGWHSCTEYQAPKKDT